MSEDVFHSVSMIMNVDPEEIAKIIHSYIERAISCDYDRLNCPKPPIYIGPVKVKSLKERLEEMKMKATSTEVFKDIIAIDFELQTFPDPDTQDKFIVSATNRDDIFCFVFEGPNLRDACRKTGLFVGWEKDQKIKELQEENKDLKKRYDSLNKKFNRVMNDNLPKTPITDAMLIDDYNKLADENEKLKEAFDKECEKLTFEKMKLKEENKQLKEEISRCNKVNEDLGSNAIELEKRMQMYKQSQTQKINELKKKLALEKAANEAQHKFVREYAGKGTEILFNYAIDDTKEVSYVIVDRKENTEVRSKILKYIEINNKLRDENEELKYQLRDIQATKEVVEQKLNTMDNVNHPSHYTGKYECIDVMQDVFGDEATNDFCLCNAFKYIWRARKKNGLEDVKKAVWYLNKYIEEAEKDGVPKRK